MNPGNTAIYISKLFPDVSNAKVETLLFPLLQPINRNVRRSRAT